MQRVSSAEACPTCGYPVQRAAPSRTSYELLVDAVRRATSMEGLVTAVAFGAIFAALGFAGAVWLVVVAAIVGYYFAIVAHVGDGKAGLPGPSDATDDWLEIAGMATRGILCVLVSLVPWLVWLRLHAETSVATSAALILAGQLYMPAVVLSIALSNNGLAVVWPIAWGQVIARAPLAYVRFLGLWLVSVAAGGIVYVVTDTLFGDVFLVSAFARCAAWCLFAFAQAALVGGYIRSHAAELGWGG